MPAKSQRSLLTILAIQPEPKCKTNEQLPEIFIMTKKSNDVSKSKELKTGRPATKQATLSTQNEPDERSKMNAKLYLSSPYPAACIVTALQDNNCGDNDIVHVFEKLLTNNIKALDNDLEHLEEVLLNQVSVLDSLFYHYIEKATKAEYVQQLETFGEIAFKAQKQCRVTVSALAELKNPRRATFIRQQNNAINQQVNNHNNSTDNQPSKTQISINPKIELLEIDHEPVDTRKTTKTIKAYPEMETVGKSQGSKNPRRKGRQQNERL